MASTPTPAPPQTLKTEDQYGDKIGVKSYQDGSLQTNNLDLLSLVQEILCELKIIRIHLELLTDENIKETDICE